MWNMMKVIVVRIMKIEIEIVRVMNWVLVVVKDIVCLLDMLLGFRGFFVGKNVIAWKFVSRFGKGVVVGIKFDVLSLFIVWSFSFCGV